MTIGSVWPPGEKTLPGTVPVPAVISRPLGANFLGGIEMPKDPWFKFFPTDWLSDSKLQSCSMASQGLFINLLCLMHQSTKPGHFLINGEKPCKTSRKRVLNVHETEYKTRIKELLKHGVLVEEDGVLVCPRMVRDQALIQSQREHGKRGGNPVLVKATLKATLKPRSQKLEPELEKDKKHMVICTAFDDRFWPAYPKKKAKPHALRAWKALKPDEETIEKILADLPRWKDTDQRFIPHPATYLNGRRWEDEDKERNKWAEWIRKGEQEDADAERRRIEEERRHRKEHKDEYLDSEQVAEITKKLGLDFGQRESR